MQSLPCILAAMIPCNRLYAYIGCQLRAAALAAPGVIRGAGPYASWIKQYSSDEFLELPASKEALLDKLGSSAQQGDSSCCMQAHENAAIVPELQITVPAHEQMQPLKLS